MRAGLLLLLLLVRALLRILQLLLSIQSCYAFLVFDAIIGCTFTGARLRSSIRTVASELVGMGKLRLLSEK
jgi:hypothetical protein